tara:strand:- start:1265 stop:2056 length:792 start_codon:yes stop_codon:yes gene_type:complete
MNKYLVIGNPIEHSLSPKLHNFWFKKNNINAVYEKQKLKEADLKEFMIKIREKKLNGINVTVPFKKKVIPFLDQLTPQAYSTKSVNTIYLENDKLFGHNTDVDGFLFGINNLNFDINGKKILILGAGGVVPSIIFALKKIGASQIIISNRTEKKAEALKNLFDNLSIVKWGKLPDFDVIINATSIGLNKIDKINLDFSDVGINKFFYDVIYNPKETDFLKIGKKLGHTTSNGKLMFIYQASEAFKIWHGIEPQINDEVIKLLD